MTEHHYSQDQLIQYIREEKNLRDKVRRGETLSVQEETTLRFIQMLLDMLSKEEGE